MTIRHHISDDLLLSYSAGTLPTAWSLVVATHLALCPECRARVRQADAVGGELLETVAPVDVGANALQGVLEMIDAAPVLEAPKPAAPIAAVQPAVSDVVLPEPLRSFAGGDLPDLKWRSLGRGAYHIPLITKGATARLLRIPAGKPVPEHGHRGRELTLVLKGSFHDGDLLFARGDVEDADEDLEHQPIATEGEDCICLAVTDAPLRFKSLGARIVQPFIGI